MPSNASRLPGSSARARSKKPRASGIFSGIPSLIEPRHALKIEVHRIGSWRPFRAARLVGHQLDIQLAREAGDDFVLHAEKVGEGSVKAVGPQMRADLRVDQLRVDANPILVALDRALEHIAHTELLADRLGVGILPLEGEGGVARDHEAVADAREVRGEIFRDAVGEVILGGIPRKIGEWQHNDREMRGPGRRRATRAQQIPGAARDQDEQRGEPAGERRKGGAGFRRGLRYRRRRLRLGGDADLKRVNPNRLGDVLELGGTEIADLEVEPRLDLPIGVLGQTDRAGLGDALQVARRY